VWNVLIPVVVGGLVGAVLFQRKSRRAVASAQRLAVDNSGPQAVAAPPGKLSAKMRLLEARGVRARWREVVIQRTENSALSATPYRPRVAASFDLSATRATGIRDARPGEKWWFAGPIVLLADGELGAIEFGFGTVSEAASAARVLGRPDLAARCDADS
jgi:hypothetical protein